ncbi:MAG TPA: GTP 3',8-cyclase MoaA [Sulfurimonas sp.]|uniref:GTP 3',8-cyclase MoaA n=1 Tax=Sulfurimonas sp. TaxID=2022749 RepID=UPI002C82AE76|nr:GTP 3',8-cyclase MoaA [Sulfurimonas sp.]HUH43221.1 GTP 3',8-cyclase MoaA [Sulfurimonas sp.]
MLIDSYERVVDYLRISVTERCNFRCQYCMPEKPFSWVPKENLLTFEELFLFVKVAIDEGIKKIRITGGEPLLREDLDKFIKMIYDYAPHIDLAMTTNAFLLKSTAQKLRDAGLKRLNVSIDTLKPEVALAIAGKDVLKNVLEGVNEALAVGLKVKVNMVPMKNMNANEIMDVLEYAKERGMTIRFIEYMENQYASKEISGLKSDELLSMLREHYEFVDEGYDGASPSRYYKMSDGYRFGIIEPYGDDFCKQCNRIRLTAEGNLIPCLYFDEALSIAKSIKAGDIVAASEVLREVVKNKPEKNRWGADDGEISSRAFYETGG